MKTHWLFGEGPNKEVKFKVEIDDEHNCCVCIHREVCDGDMSKRCSNYVSVGSCDNRKACYSGCLHKFTRFDKDETKIPCFHCKWYLAKKE